MRDPVLFAGHFRGETWQAWEAFLAALFALPMSAERRDIYTACTGRNALPDVPFTEAWLIAGRRSGKSRILAMIAVYLACFRDWTPFLAPGERGTVMVIAADRR